MRNTEEEALPCLAGIYASIWLEAGNPGLYAGSTPAECGSTGLYEGLGFVSEGVRPNFYDKPKDNAVIMWLRQAERI